ncbi:putative lipid II flippase FtsW [Candidatus Saccharibacteria bacterium]|jgi:cell division protein FtsW|nr:putative lipid II flippase FtsW [Candidatus Saccharibacteria bacterium]
MRRHKPDYNLLIIIGLLLLLGLLIIYSISPVLANRQGSGVSERFYVIKQLVNIIISLGAFAAAAKIPIKSVKKFLPFILVITLIANLAVFIPGLGVEVKGATRWINLGFTTFQPSELLKLTSIIYLGYFLSSKNEKEIADYRQTMLPLGILLGLIGILVAVLQRDLGTMIVIAAIFLGLIFLSNVPMKQMLALGLSVISFGILFIVLFPHRIARFLTFLDPTSDVQGAGYHIHQALIAIGSGGWTGLGLGRSVQVYGYLPEAANDSIFAVWAEKFGLVGSVVLLLIFGILLHRIYFIARRSGDQSKRLISMGVMIWLGSHIVLNIGAMLSLLPLKGITLPFLSYGGTSLVFIMFAMGLVFQLSRYTEHEPVTVSAGQSGSRSNLRQPRTGLASTSARSGKARKNSSISAARPIRPRAHSARQRRVSRPQRSISMRKSS